LSCAYAATGNIWLAAGVHTRINFASGAKSGLWHLCGLVRVSGDDVLPAWTHDLVMVVLAVGLYTLGRRGRWRESTTSVVVPGTVTV